eukprot:Selendium_serpulae@DN3648_c0_g1_i1.p1
MKIAALAVAAAMTVAFAMAHPADYQFESHVESMGEPGVDYESEIYYESQVRREEQHSYDSHHGFACRGPDGPSDNSNSYYRKIREGHNDCRRECDSSSSCTGYETGRNGHCEIWHHRIGHRLERKSSLACHVKLL